MSDQWSEKNQQGQWEQQQQPPSSAWQQFGQFPAASSQFPLSQQTMNGEEDLPSQQFFPTYTPWKAQQAFQQTAWEPDQFPQLPAQPPPPGKMYISKKVIIFSLLIFVVIVASIAGIFLVLLPHLQPRNIDITVDFGNGQSVTYPIQKGMFGLGYKGFATQFNNVSNYLPKAGITALRDAADFTTIFPTLASATNPSQQVWTDFDNFISTAQSLRAHPIIILNASPLWLQPQMQHPPLPNPCSPIHANPSHVKPVFMVHGVDEGAQRWGELAAQAVARMDHKFPGVNPDYEIWNEPDGITFMCVSTNNLNAGKIRLAQYKAIYGVAARLMKQQAQKDQRQISTGGPALAFPARHATMWLNALVNDPQIAPYIDFISYHHYITDKTTDTWSELLAETQDSKMGAAAVFETVSAIVRAGKQPHAQSTPIYIDEYNTNTKLADCCRNTQAYAPLWNAVFVSDLFNTVVDKHAAAHAVPAFMLYFTANRDDSQFCMFGTLDAKMDCALGKDIQPYPQFYTYQLLNDPAFLGLSNGGYVANAPTLGNSKNTAGLLMTAFYTSGKDNLLIVNTDGQNYQQFNIALQNTRNVKTEASLYILNQANPHIGVQHVSLSSDNNGYTVAIDIPAYSIMALSLDTAS